MELIHRAARLMGWLGALLVPTGGWVWGLRAAAGLALGMLWALVNVWVLAHLIETLMSSTRAPWWRRIGLWTIKLPLLYAAVVAIFLVPWISPVAFLIGVSLWFVALMIGAVREVWA